MIAKNIHGQHINEIRSKFAGAIANGFKPTLAIVFCSIVQDRKSIVDFFNEQQVDVFGATTAGEIVDDEVMEQSTVIMLLDIKKEYYRIFTKQSQQNNTYQISQSAVMCAKEYFSNPSVILISSGLTIDAEQIIKGVKDVDANIPLYGGLAGDDLTMKASYVFSNAFESPDGIIALIIDNNKVNVQGIATSGWDNIGIEKTITKSDGNIVYSIDGESAVDVFVKYFQFTGSVDNKAEIIAMNFAQYPLQLKKDNGNTVLRAPLMVNTDTRALIFAGGIPEGSKVKFSVPPGFDLVEKTASEISNLKTTIPSADAILMFSCKARHLALGPMTADEAASVRSIWDKPLLGFFTYGEIGTAKDSTCDFHNETCSMVVVKEIG